MLIRELFEARRNPNLNQKEYTYQLIKRRYDETNDYIGPTKNLFVNFIGIDKIGVNPNPRYRTTPLGVYGYTVDYIVDNINPNQAMNNLQYAGDSKFLNLFNVKGNIINFETLTESDVETYFTRIKKLFTSEQDIKSINAIVNDYGKDPLDFWNCTERITKTLVKGGRFISNWTMLLRKIGIDGVIDPGYSIIHENEPAQIVVFTPSSIINNKRFFNNKGDPTLNQFSKKYGQEQHQLTSKFYPLFKSMSVDELVEYFNSNNPELMKFVRRPEQRVALIRNKPHAILYIKNPTDAERIEAIKSFPSKIPEYYDTSWDNALIKAINQNIPIGQSLLEKINDHSILTDEVKETIVKNNPNLFFIIQKPNKQLTDIAIQSGANRKTAMLRHLGLTETQLIRRINNESYDVEFINSSIDKLDKQLKTKNEEIIALEGEIKKNPLTKKLFGELVKDAKTEITNINKERYRLFSALNEYEKQLRYYSSIANDLGIKVEEL
jgi:predicted  nucleic acid-binding Zn-ribbon protein